LFTEILSEVRKAAPAIHLPAPGRGNWLPFASGPFGYWCLSVIADGRLRVEAYVDTGLKELNKALFDTMFAERNKWEQAVGMELTWEPLPDKRACRIGLSTTTSLWTTGAPGRWPWCGA
jgi:hypothetical protein